MKVVVSGFRPPTGRHRHGGAPPAQTEPPTSPRATQTPLPAVTAAAAQ